LLLTPTPKAGLDKVRDKNLRPRDARPFSGYSLHDRAQHMTEAADEIAGLVGQIAQEKSATPPSGRRPQLAYVHITGLPETAYERLVGRDDQLKQLDEAWSDAKTNIISLVAEGGAGKSALVNEWLKQLQADNYRGAEAVLGWSFYSQGTKERATSAEQFLAWAIDKLGIKLETASPTSKGEAIAEDMARRRVLLVLDGVEPLQHGPGPQIGQLKDFGVRALLRRFAATPPGAAHGLLVLTSRLPLGDIGRWRDGAAPIVDVDRLSDGAGAALLRDNGVWGTDTDLKTAARDFGGHPLGLALLASFLKDTQTGDVRRRDHIRAYLADPDNPRHDHASRVMESYEKEWLVGQPVLHAVMHMIGLFDRPASADCLKALRGAPAIDGLTNRIVPLDESAWQRAVARLREARLLAPADPTARNALDAHPLVREWFGERLRQTNEVAWKAAHGRLYDHLRDATHEGQTPTLDDLAPLYQAIAHGCRAGRQQEALEEIYIDRICRSLPGGGLRFYTAKSLGAFGSDLAAISWFFARPYDAPVASLKESYRAWVLAHAATYLRTQGRFAEALPAMRAALPMAEDAAEWGSAAVRASNLSETELLAGDVSAAVSMAERSVAHADRSADEFQIMTKRTTEANALHAAGRRADAARLFADAERRQEQRQPQYPLLYSLQGYYYCDLLLDMGESVPVRKRATKILQWEIASDSLLDRALVRLTLARAYHGLALVATSARRRSSARNDARLARDRLDQTVDRLRAYGAVEFTPRGLLARAAFRRGTGDWDGAARDLDEVEEIAGPGPMRLFLCDIALERAQLAFARVEAFAPLNGMLERDNPPKPSVPSPEQIAQLKDEAARQLAAAAKLIETCGYRRRDEELAELKAVLAGKKTFATLPPRV
jgi:hypothetical protein